MIRMRSDTSAKVGRSTADSNTGPTPGHLALRKGTTHRATGARFLKTRYGSVANGDQAAAIRQLTASHIEASANLTVEGVSPSSRIAS